MRIAPRIREDSRGFARSSRRICKFADRVRKDSRPVHCGSQRFSAVNLRMGAVTPPIVVEVAVRGLIQARVHGSHDRRSHKTDTQKESTSNECALAYNRVTVAEASPKPEPVPWFQTRASSRYKHTGRLYPMCIFCLGMCKGGRLVFPGVP